MPVRVCVRAHMTGYERAVRGSVEVRGIVCNCLCIPFLLCMRAAYLKPLLNCAHCIQDKSLILPPNAHQRLSTTTSTLQPQVQRTNTQLSVTVPEGVFGGAVLSIGASTGHRVVVTHKLFI